MSKSNRARRGAPRKEAGGLDRVLYVRTSERLLNLLDEVVEQERRSRPGHSISRADVARDLLYSAVRNRGLMEEG